jgi:acetyltransferase
MGPHHLSSMFDPRTVGVFGASDREGSVAGRLFRNLVEGGFEGKAYAINPKHATVLGRQCYASLGDVPEPVDLAVIASPARTVPGIFEECGAAGIRNAVVITAGFGETGEEGRTAERRLLETARRHDMRFIGPNCVGLVRPWRSMNASFLKTRTPPGKLALVSQSGALCSAIADWAEPNHLGISALVSLGNSVDIGFGEAVSFLAADQKTEAILIYVEGVRDARSFVSELRAAARIKPVVVLKGGRHRKSSAAASTHTGALVGSNAAFDAALERAGAVRAMTFGQLFAAAEMLSAHRRAGGNRLCIITNGGGAGVLAADAAEDLGLEIAPPSQKTREALDAFLPPYWSRSNPIDILGDATPETYGRATATCLDDAAFDGVLVMLTPQAMTQPLDAAREVVKARRNGGGKPVLACWMGESSVTEARELLSSSGIPDFTTPERAVEAFSHLACHERNRRLSLEVPGPQLFSAAQDLTGARMILDGALADGRSMLSDTESKAILRAFGIPTVTTIEAATPAKALIAAETLGFPVALKVLSPQISHKSDVGGVVTNIARAADVRPAFIEIVERAKTARPGAEIRGVTVEKMAAVAHARELLVGVSRDPVFGPVIAFGAGGTMVEVVRDNAVALPPLTTVLAERLIEKTRVSRELEAHRNVPAAMRSAIVEVLLRVSDMVTELPEIVELDINPLFAGPDGVIAVDARIGVARPPNASGPYDHTAIAPYPRHLVEHDFLADGRPLTIRPTRPEDAQSEQAFVRGLSAEARRLRFLQSLKELSPSMLAQFTQVDYAREMGLVAIVDTDGVEEQVGAARYVSNPDGRSCEFAIVVSDKVQGQGIGSRLMKALIRAARAQGLAEMNGVVLADNAPMLQLMRELGFSIRAVAGDPSLVEVERRL